MLGDWTQVASSAWAANTLRNKDCFTLSFTQASDRIRVSTSAGHFFSLTRSVPLIGDFNIHMDNLGFLPKMPLWVVHMPGKAKARPNGPPYEYLIFSDPMKRMWFVLARDISQFTVEHGAEVRTWLSANGFDTRWNHVRLNKCGDSDVPAIPPPAAAVIPKEPAAPKEEASSFPIDGCELLWVFGHSCHELTTGVKNIAVNLRDMADGRCEAFVRSRGQSYCAMRDLVGDKDEAYEEHVLTCHAFSLDCAGEKEGLIERD
ncbi:unnamed protein product [Chrysoparadoxa australica]